MTLLLHITERAAWARAQAEGRYTAPSLDSEGFIHASTPAQVVATAERFYRGRRDLVLLCIDPDRLDVPVRFEAPVTVGSEAPGERFPHIHGAVPVTAVVAVVDFPPRPDGGFDLPLALPT